MSQFFQRIANYVGNEIIVKGLANSKLFQRFAVRTSSKYEEFSKTGAESLNKAVDEMMKETAAAAAASKGGGTLTGPPKPPLRGLAGFLSAFAKEAKRDFSVRERW